MSFVWSPESTTVYEAWAQTLQQAAVEMEPEPERETRYKVKGAKGHLWDVRRCRRKICKDLFLWVQPVQQQPKAFIVRSATILIRSIVYVI